TLISGRLGDWYTTPEHRHGRITPSRSRLAISSTTIMTGNFLGHSHHRLSTFRIGRVRSYLNTCYQRRTGGQRSPAHSTYRGSMDHARRFSHTARLKHLVYRAETVSPQAGVLNNFSGSICAPNVTHRLRDTMVAM